MMSPARSRVQTHEVNQQFKVEIWQPVVLLSLGIFSCNSPSHLAHQRTALSDLTGFRFGRYDNLQRKMSVGK